MLNILDPVLKGYVSPAKTPNAAPVTGMHDSDMMSVIHNQKLVEPGYY